jgi:hypothetical protein
MAYFSSRSTCRSLSSRTKEATHARTLDAVSRRRTRLLTAGLMAVGCVLGLAGCNNANLSRRELVVHFTPDATRADHDNARSACTSAAPHASPEPAPAPTSHGVDPAYDVRFRVDHASDRDLNQLVQCLRRQHGVLGFDLPDADG